MVNNWKRLCLILLSIVILESVYIFKIRFDEGSLSLQANNWKSSAVYYGNSGKAEVQLIWKYIGQETSHLFNYLINFIVFNLFVLYKEVLYD